MDRNNIVKKGLLRRKIKEYFAKNTSAKSMIVKADVGDTKTIWRVVKEQNKFRITEVNTAKDQFIMEAETQDYHAGNPIPDKIGTDPTLPPPIPEDPWDPENKNGEFAKINKEKGPIQAMANMPDDKLKRFFGLNKAQWLKSMELYQSGPKADARRKEDQKQKADARVRRNAKQGIAGLSPQPSGISSSPGGKINSGKEVKGKLKTERKIVKEEGEEKGKDLEAGNKSADAVGEKPTAPTNPEVKQTEEMAAISRTLKGQTIQEAKLDPTPEGGVLTLQILGSTSPAKLEWQKSGKIVYHFDNVPYIIRRA